MINYPSFFPSAWNTRNQLDKPTPLNELVPMETIRINHKHILLKETNQVLLTNQNAEFWQKSYAYLPEENV